MKSVLFAAVGLLGVSANAHAAALNLIPGRPDGFSNTVQVAYNSSTHILTASGIPQNVVLTPGGSQINVIGGGAANSFSLSVNINNDGTIGAGGAGSLSFIADHGGNDQTLFSAITLTQFGFSNGLLEFVFSGTGSGGTLNGGHLPTGVIVSDVLAGAAFTNFNTSFNNSGSTFVATSDTFVIPAPGAASLAFLGLGAMVRRRR